MSADNSEQTARQIAAAGREALLARLRPAFERAAAAHADILQIPPERLDAMIRAAADRADGLQWRRALAGVAVEQLGIDLLEALRHPAVARAQELLGAPSYESALGTAGAGAVAGAGAGASAGAGARAPEPRAPEPSAPVERAPEPPPSAPEPPPRGPEPPPRASEPPARTPEPVPAVPEPPVAAPSVSADPAAGAPTVPPVPATPGLEELEEYEGHEGHEGHEEHDSSEPAHAAGAAPAPGSADVNVPAVHLGGIANLAPGEEGLELRFADPGLDIARENDAILGRIAWKEIRSVEVAAPGRLRRRKGPEAKIVIHTERGDASFRVPGAEEEDLRRQLAPALARIQDRD